MSVTDTPTRDLLQGLAALAETEHLTVGKDGHNPHFNYDYMTEAALFTAARAALAEAGLSGTISFAQGSHETITTFNKDGEERPGVMATVMATLTIRDQLGNEVVCSAFGQGIDNADKAYYKAMTGASKYVVQKALMIAVEGDDADASDSSTHVARRSGGGGGGPASEKQLGYLCSLIKKIHLVPSGATAPMTEAMALRLVCMSGDTPSEFAAIGKAAASGLIERLKKVEDNEQAGTVILERLAAWEAEHDTPPAEPFADTPAAGQPDEPVAAYDEREF